MKKLILIAASLLVTGGVFALIAASNATADAGHEEGSASSSTSSFWEHMSEMRDIMHNALVKSEPLSNGVRIEVTGTQPELIASIQEEFASDRHEVKAPFPNTEVATEVLENGVALAFTSTDGATVDRIQAQGSGLFYAMLRDNMHELMAGQGMGGGRFGGMHGQGWMGGGMMGGGGQYGPGQGAMGGGMMGGGNYR